MNSFRILFVFFTICAIAALGYAVEIEDIDEPTMSEDKCYDFFNKHNKNGSNSKNQHAFVNFVCQHQKVSIFLAIIALIVAISIVSCVCRCLCGCVRSGRGYQEFA